ncbi:hypothetical protein CBL_00228 [Carabus blaptoides fortunei]
MYEELVSLLDRTPALLIYLLQRFVLSILARPAAPTAAVVLFPTATASDAAATVTMGVHIFALLCSRAQITSLVGLKNVTANGRYPSRYSITIIPGRSLGPVTLVRPAPLMVQRLSRHSLISTNKSGRFHPAGVNNQSGAVRHSSDSVTLDLTGCRSP